MLKLPGNLTAATFLERHWQKQALFIPGACQRLRPSISRNELGWLATLADVESRLVFVARDEAVTRYRAETGPFATEYLQNLPKRDWTLLVYDVEKHLPAMRALFRYVPFVPDWRIDDLMVSFAAPGGGVGPHRDKYDVFLCQGTGIRNWRISGDPIRNDPRASDDLALLDEFVGDEDYDAAEGDVLYLPPGVAHWGTARRSCMTYSIGMRAPQACDIAPSVGTAEEDPFYRDPDLKLDEIAPGYISARAAARAAALPGSSCGSQGDAAVALGRFATRNKDWLKPDAATRPEVDAAIEHLRSGGRLEVHGMSQIAFDERHLYVNGSSSNLPAHAQAIIEKICASRRLSASTLSDIGHRKMVVWMLQQGAFEIPENS